MLYVVRNRVVPGLDFDCGTKHEVEARAIHAKSSLFCDIQAAVYFAS
jgi:hypothetical protein